MIRQLITLELWTFVFQAPLCPEALKTAFDYSLVFSLAYLTGFLRGYKGGGRICYSVWLHAHL